MATARINVLNAYGRNSRITITPCINEGMALLGFAFSDQVTKFDPDTRLITCRDAYCLEEITRIRKALAATERSLRRGT